MFAQLRKLQCFKVGSLLRPVLTSKAVNGLKFFFPLNPHNSIVVHTKTWDNYDTASLGFFLIGLICLLRHTRAFPQAMKEYCT